jgi:hypothetical protein
LRKELFLLKLQMYEEVWGFKFRSLGSQFLPAAKEVCHRGTEALKPGLYSSAFLASVAFNLLRSNNTDKKSCQNFLCLPILPFLLPT